VCRKYHLDDHIQLNTEVTNLRWIEDEQLWEGNAIQAAPRPKSPGTRDPKKATTVTFRATVVISAVGKLTEPKFSAVQGIPGIERFEGQIVHTARWDDSLDLEGKDVLVIGSGCSAAQLVPALVSPGINAKSVTQLMRSPPWVTPDILSGETLRLWERYTPMLMRNIPGLAWIVRAMIFAISESNYFLLFRSTSSARANRAKRKDGLLKYMEQLVPMKFHQMLLPTYEVGCKRLIYDNGWFNALGNPHVDIFTGSMRCIENNIVTIESIGGQEVTIRADVIILATGYDTRSLLHSLPVTGRGGLELHDVWEQRGGPQAYMGVAMDKFPNFFMLFGPNSSNSYTSVIIGIENSVQYAMELIKPVITGYVSSCEVKEEACRGWTRKIQNASQDSVWTSGGCRNWYVSEAGWNAMIYP
jgi:cation diffusion facilitator CzcD-associated flavoprotein CzcO